MSNRKIVKDIRDVFSGKVMMIEPHKAVGKISADIVYPCPPGYPILIYGEQVTEYHIEFLKDKKEILVVE